MKIILASKNPYKLDEIGAITAQFGLELVLPSALGLDIDVEETGTTFEENSRIKAETLVKASGLAAIADDSGLAVEALGGAPGIYSARYGFDESLDDRGRTALLLKNMENVPDDARQAKFVCVITLLTPNGECIQVRGEVHGQILRQPCGENGFGYDPVFYYPPLDKTLAQMTAEEKNQVSHRARALQKLNEKLKERNYVNQ